MIKESEHENINPNNDEFSLQGLILKFREWWRYIILNWMFIFLFAILGGVLGAAYAYFKKPIYTATTTFVLEDEKSSGGLGNLAGLASIAGVDLGGSGGGIFQGDNILGLYKSRTMLERTLLSKAGFGNANELLVDRYIKFNQLREKWAEKPELAALKFNNGSVGTPNSLIVRNRLKDSVLSVIINDLNKNYLTVAKPDKKLSIIKVDVKAKDETFAKAFNDALVKNVNEFYINTKTKKNMQNIMILQNKTDSVRAVMNGAIYSAVAVADATPNLNPTRQVQRVAPAQRAQFSAETNKAILSEMVKNLELTKMSLLKETPLIQVVDQPVLPLEVMRYGFVTSAIKGLGLLVIASVISLITIYEINKVLKK